MIAFYFIQKLIKRLMVKTTGENEHTNDLATLAAWCLIGVALLFVFGAIVNNCNSCRTRRAQNKLDNINAEIFNANVGKEILESEKKGANQNSVNAAEAVNGAEANLREKQRANVSNINGAELDAMANKYR